MEHNQEWLLKLKEINPNLAEEAQDYLDKLGADIRNKLSPPKNLLALLNHSDMKIENEKMYEIIKKEMKMAEESISYLSEIVWIL